MSPINKKVYPLVILIAVAIGIYFGFHSRRNPPAEKVSSENPRAVTNSTQPSQPRTNTPSAVANASPESPVNSSQPSPSTVPTVSPKGPLTPYLVGSAEAQPQMEPMTLLGNVRHAIKDYGSMFGGNPVGTNPEITAALNGENPKGVRFLKEDLGIRVNGQGELVDSWGSPFFFHQISGTETEIRSAGPDRKMYTADDLVLK